MKCFVLVSVLFSLSSTCVPNVASVVSILIVPSVLTNLHIKCMYVEKKICRKCLNQSNLKLCLNISNIHIQVSIVRNVILLNLDVYSIKLIF